MRCIGSSSLASNAVSGMLLVALTFISAAWAVQVTLMRRRLRIALNQCHTQYIYLRPRDLPIHVINPGGEQALTIVSPAEPVLDWMPATPQEARAMVDAGAHQQYPSPTTEQQQQQPPPRQRRVAETNFAVEMASTVPLSATELDEPIIHPPDPDGPIFYPIDISGRSARASASAESEEDVPVFVRRPVATSNLPVTPSLP